MADVIIQVLEKTISPDKTELETAQNYLEQAARTNLPEFVQSLSDVLFNPANSPVARKAAGLQLKNTLTSKDSNITFQYQQRWLEFPEEVRSYVKKNVLGALGTETLRPSQVAQCVAYIAVAELPQNQWLDLIQLLTHNVTNAASTEMMKESTLEAIGYICQDIDPAVLSTQSNDILTAIVHGMKKDEPSDYVKLAATTALLNSLEFTKANFDKESERHFIMQVVCEATQSTCTQVRVAALQCLVKIMSLYYQYMEHYMGPALFAITMEAMKSEMDEEALQGIEFWSNVCEEEINLAIDSCDAAEDGRPPDNISMHYAKGALAYLVPILMHMLTKQEEFDDDDDWNPCKAAGVCLMTMANCCEDDIIEHVLPFVNKNVEHAEWRYRDAAIMAFGSILSGPDTKNLKPIVEAAMPFIIKMMSDSSVSVRDTTAWVIGRIFQTVPEVVVKADIFEPLLTTLVAGLTADPRIAANVCWAFSSLAESCYDLAREKEDNDDDVKTYILSKYFDGIVTELLETTDRADGNQANLRSAAYEALMEMVKNSPKDCYVIVQKTTMTILQRLQQVLQLEGHIQSNSDRAQYNDLQSLLCATLQSVLRKMTPEDAPQISDAIMAALLQMFSSNTKSGGVQEDALMAVSTLVEVLGDKFIKYMEAFKPYLSVGLRNYSEHQVCLAAVGLTGDICRALSSDVLPYCDEIMSMLLSNLCNNDIDKSIKPQILSVFGDVALAIGTKFNKYLTIVLQTLTQATMVHIEKTDFDMIDYLNSLRDGCLEAYTGIVQGFKGDQLTINSEVKVLEPHVQFMVEFVISIAHDPDHSDGNIAGAAGLIGDLISCFGTEVLQLVDQVTIVEMLSKGRRSKSSKTRTLATWATKELKRIKSAINNQTNANFQTVVASS